MHGDISIYNGMSLSFICPIIGYQLSAAKGGVDTVRKSRRQSQSGKSQQPKPKLGELFDIPRSAMFLGELLIEVTGNTGAVVTGCTGVLEYSPQSVRLGGGKLNVRFNGRALQIKALTADSVIVEGFILSIEFAT